MDRLMVDVNIIFFTNLIIEPQEIIIELEVILVYISIKQNVEVKYMIETVIVKYIDKVIVKLVINEQV